MKTTKTGTATICGATDVAPVRLLNMSTYDQRPGTSRFETDPPEAPLKLGVRQSYQIVLGGGSHVFHCEGHIEKSKDIIEEVSPGVITTIRLPGYLLVRAEDSPLTLAPA